MMINNVWILIANASGEISYGIDEEFYIVGVYSDEQEAKTTFTNYKDSDKYFKNQDGELLIRDEWGTLRFRAYPEEDDILLKYSDLRYIIQHFEGKPVYCGGAAYME